MDIAVWIMVVVFGVLLALNVPVAVAIGLAALSMALLTLPSFEIGAATLAQRMATGVNSFTLLAIPFFILSGLLMGQGGMARRLMDLANALVGRFAGGLAYVNVLTCMLFGAISGSATAAVSSIGGFMIPEMERKGYDRAFSVAITTTAATTGLLIPPSNIMIVYALVAGGAVSIAALFTAGILPGIVFGLLLMIAARLLSRKSRLGDRVQVSGRELWHAFVNAVPSLLLVVVVLGGIMAGVFTATEGAAVAVAYAFVLSVLVYREVAWRDVPGLLLQTGITTGVIFLLIGTSMAMSWMLALAEVPQRVSMFLLGLSENKIVILLLVNLLLLAVGTFMDMTPAVLIFTPIFYPALARFGMDPLHFGIMLIANLCIGLCTPPVGTCLFVGCSVGRTTLARVTPALLPFFGALGLALLVITYVPAISLLLPRWFGLL